MTGRHDVCFVLMPHAPIQRPSIALGLLQARLNQAGIPTTTRYANLAFAEAIGVNIYQFYGSLTQAEHLFFDWIFAEALHGGEGPDDDAFIDDLFRRCPDLLVRPRLVLEREIWSLRGAAMRFIDAQAREIVAGRPKVVGCSSTFQQHVASLALFRRIKELDPGIVTLFGGANCETRMGLATHRLFPQVDYVVSGEADDVVVPLVTRLVGGETDIRDDLPYGVYAPCHRDTEYPLVTVGDGAPRAVIEDLRASPLPDYDDYFTQLGQASFRDLVLPSLPFETSRGCWWGAISHCTFCGLNGTSMAFRAKTGEQALDEIERLFARYRVTSFDAVDNIMSVDYFKDFLPQLAERGRPFRFFYETKSNLKRDQLRLLRDAGVLWIQPGIESFSSELLKLMGKGVQGWANLQTLKWAAQYGIRVIWAQLMGFPGEDDRWLADVARMIPMIAHLQPGFATTVRIDRYSMYHRNPERYGITLAPMDVYGQVYRLPREDLVDLAYFFQIEEGAFDARRNWRAAEPGHEGMRALLQAVSRWRSAWADPDKSPQLVMRDRDDGDVEVFDTRPLARAETSVLTGIQAAALRLAVRDTLTEARFVERLAAEAEITTDAAAAAVDDLVAAHLALRIDDRVFGLPLIAPVTPPPANWLYPNGLVLKAPDAAALAAVYA